MHYVQVTPPPSPPTTAIFRTFKKSTAPYEVHNMGLRYIKIISNDDIQEQERQLINAKNLMSKLGNYSPDTGSAWLEEEAAFFLKGALA